MADIDLTQAEADSLIAMEKHRVSDEQFSFPVPGGRLAIPLQSPDRRELFTMDVTRSGIKLTKATFQNRGRKVVVLLRLDIDGALHRNPDGVEVPCPHLYVYREGYADKWAVPAPPGLVAVDGSLHSTVGMFMQRCNVTQVPIIQQGLF